MKLTAFTDSAPIVHAIDELQSHWQTKKRQISDVVDADGNQYIDLVMEGGGVLGIALVGYTYALESVGIRFLGVGGTSAGAINALMVAAVDTPGEAKSTKILEILCELKMFEFVDGDTDARDFVRALVERAGLMKLGWKGMQVLDNLREDLGLNPGTKFVEWLKDNLAKNGVGSLSDLTSRMRSLPELKTRDGRTISPDEADPKLALIAADISTETKAVFPRMAGLYFKDPNSVSPAEFVRASMSIPGFFWPYRLGSLPQGKNAARLWKSQANYTGALPKEVLFVDGGIVSNFPIDLFHAPGVPIAPTFGVKLGKARTQPNQIERPLEMLGAIFESARHAADEDFIRKNPDYKQLVSYIDTGRHNWLDFFMADEAKVDLFARGVHTAKDFLMGFDWQAYKRVRSAGS